MRVVEMCEIRRFQVRSGLLAANEILIEGLVSEWQARLY